MLQINDRITISAQYIHVAYVRSSGPGGQNVNKVSTRAQLRFDLADYPDLTAAVKKRLAVLAGRRLTKEHTLVLESDRFRDQLRNRRECLDRLRRLILQALITPKKRRATKPTLASKRRRLAEKRRRSETKSLRRKPPPHEQ